MGFCNRLKEARLKKKYTQEQIADIIGVAKSTYTGYEKGNREPNMLTISKMLKALDIDANYLWQDETTFPFELTYDEMEHLVKKYRELDTHGTKVVDFILQEEWERSTASNKKESNVVSMVKEDSTYMINAAHADDYMNAPDELKQLEEDMLDTAFRTD